MGVPDEWSLTGLSGTESGLQTIRANKLFPVGLVFGGFGGGGFLVWHRENPEKKVRCPTLDMGLID